MTDAKAAVIRLPTEVSLQDVLESRCPGILLSPVKERPRCIKFSEGRWQLNCQFPNSRRASR